LVKVIIEVIKMKNLIDKAREWVENRLTSQRLTHVTGAEETAQQLAKMFNIDPDKAGIAALLHDNAKGIKQEKLLEIINKNNIPVTEWELKSKKTLHAPVGAFFAKEELGIQDNEILDAIRWHTLGKINMSNLEKIVFLADKIESNTRDEEFRKKVLKAINETNNLDEGILLCYDATIRSLLDRKLTINPQTIDVWNSLIFALNKSK